MKSIAKSNRVVIAEQMSSGPGQASVASAGDSPGGRIPKRDVKQASKADLRQENVSQREYVPIIQGSGIQTPANDAMPNGACLQCDGNGAGVLLHGFRAELNSWRSPFADNRSSSRLFALDIRDDPISQRGQSVSGLRQHQFRSGIDASEIGIGVAVLSYDSMAHTQRGKQYAYHIKALVAGAAARVGWQFASDVCTNGGSSFRLDPQIRPSQGGAALATSLHDGVAERRADGYCG